MFYCILRMHHIWYGFLTCPPQSWARMLESWDPATWLWYRKWTLGVFGSPWAIRITEIKISMCKDILAKGVRCFVALPIVLKNQYLLLQSLDQPLGMSGLYSRKEKAYDEVHGTKSIHTFL